jgi:hypothetical protein
MPRIRISEDWLATLIGLAIVLLIASGLLGPIPWPVFGLFAR